jgi:hypothetical protein
MPELQAWLAAAVSMPRWAAPISECQRPAALGAGTRQLIFKLYNAENSTDPDVKFFEGRVGDYETQLRSHKFCIAPW